MLGPIGAIISPEHTQRRAHGPVTSDPSRRGGRIYQIIEEGGATPRDLIHRALQETQARVVVMAIAKIVRYFSVAARASILDIKNRIQYGNVAPRYAERIFVDIAPHVKSLGLGKRLFGQVLGEWPPMGRKTTYNFTDTEPYISCAQHWLDGVAWENTRAYQRMAIAIQRKGVADGCTSMEDVSVRYEALDRLFEKIEKDGQIMPHSQFEPWSFRELGGMVFHVGPDAEPFFGRIGQHRLAIALILGIQNVPAALGGVYKGALPALHRLRIARDQG